MGSKPLIGRSLPSRASSPRIIDFFGKDSICSETKRIPMAIGRSKAGPSFFKSAGARLTVILPKKWGER